MFEALIYRLQDRIRRAPCVDIDQSPSIRPSPPVAQQAMAAAESEIGFKLPSLLRTLYTDVADGGYGPGRGFIRLAGEWSLVELAKWTCSSEGDIADDSWPPRLVQVVSWGCHYMSCVD